MRLLALLAPLSVLLLLLAGRADTAAEDRPVAYRGARIHTAEGAPIEKGVLVVHKGKILAVGSVDDTEIPERAHLIDVRGKTIIPGIVDTHSHIGIWPRPHVPAHNDGNEGSGPVQSGLRALDAIFPEDPGIRMATAGGVTTANIMPGSGNVIGGQTLYVKLRGRTIEAMRVQSSKVPGGLKMANGENPKRFNSVGRKSAPTTRMKLAALQREQFVKAKQYQQRWQAHRNSKDKSASPPEHDLDLEPLVEVLQRKRTVHFHSHRADDLMTAIRLSKEFDFELVLQHATEGYRIVEELVSNHIPVSLTLVDSPGGKLEVAGLLEENAAILDRAGVKVAINSDDSITESRFMLRTGAIAVRGGMSEDAALRALTLHGAQMLHLEDRLGSLAKGKDADFVVLSGPPFSVYTQVLQTYIDGERVFDRDRSRDWSYQGGGFALADRDLLPRAPAPLEPQSVVQAPRGPDSAARWRPGARSYAVLAGRLHTMGPEGTLTNGVVLVRDGKVKAVGPRDKVQIPEDVPVLTAAVVTPGLIDAHTVVGLSGAANVEADQDQDEMSDPNQADLRVLDSFNPSEPLLELLCREGVTAVHAVPGRVNVIAGQTGVFQTAGRTAERMMLRFPAGLLVNLGEVPKDSYSHRLPTTRMGTASLVRAAFQKAGNAIKSAADSKEKQAPASAKLEAFRLALEGKVPVIFAAHRADDLLTGLRLAKEFKLQPRLDLATEGYLIADELRQARVPVVVHPTMQRAAASMETYHSSLCNAAVLADHGVPVVLGTGFEGYVPKTRVLRYEAAMALVNGLGYERTLRAVTLEPARLLGIADKRGSLEEGKAADLVLYDGDPFEHSTHVLRTIIDGRVVYDREDYLKLPFARRALPLTGSGVGCCLGAW